MEATTGLIKRRREMLGWSLQELANKVGVSKSYLSRIESGDRSLTEGQAKLLALMLGAPADLLLLESGRLPADVQDAIEADAAGVTTALRARTEQAAIAFPAAPNRKFDVQPRTRVLSADREAAIPQRIEVTKATTTYRAHSYHTKVPPSAILPFIEAFTDPGDLVSDPFCGSGMTGVAALERGRNAVLSDLSPAAVHIARNYTAPCDPKAFRSAFNRVKAAVEPTMAWLYTPIGASRQIEYTVWSDVFECDACETPVVYWDALHHRAGGELVCPVCTAVLRKTDLKWLGEQPVQTHVAGEGRRILQHAPTAAELALIGEVGDTVIPYWTPTLGFAADREMWRSAHGAMGIQDASGFYSCQSASNRAP